jgi:predicted dehydrogenase
VKQLKFAVLGAGNRGSVYGDYLLHNPGQGQVVAVAEPRTERREIFARKHGIPPARQFSDWESLLDARPEADAIIIATQDRLHAAPAIRALSLGYHVLLEKPISPDPAECLAVAEAAERSGRTLVVCHVLRYTPFMQEVRSLLQAGRIGRLVSVQWTEGFGWDHIAHSFVRGNWRRSDETSPMILAKSCHDMDLIQWLVGEECRRVSSFGSLMHFRPENAPPGATERCTDGCAVEPECPYSALKIYLVPDVNFKVRALTTDHSYEGRYRALREGPYGRCVYRCDNNVVDHQVVNLEFAGGVTVSFTMTGFTTEDSRAIKFFGTEGEMRCHYLKNEIEVRDFRGRAELVRPELLTGGHGGGDAGLMQAFLWLLRTGDAGANLTSARVSAESHLLAFAAEESRLSGRTVEFREYVRSVARA